MATIVLTENRRIDRLHMPLMLCKRKIVFAHRKGGEAGKKKLTESVRPEQPYVLVFSFPSPHLAKASDHNSTCHRIWIGRESFTPSEEIKVASKLHTVAGGRVHYCRGKSLKNQRRVGVFLNLECFVMAERLQRPGRQHRGHRTVI